MNTRKARAALHACALLGGFASAGLGCEGAARDRAPDEGAAANAAGAAQCDVPRAGCACAGNQVPLPCTPDDAQVESGYCLEGVRRCVQGRFGACEDVRRFAVAETAQHASLVDVTAQHAQCSDCEPGCYRVPDNLDPADGALEGAFADGVRYHSSGAGLTLEPNIVVTPVGPPPTGLPDGALYLQIAEGLTASASHSARVRPEQSDVYLLLDQSLGMAEETLWIHDAFDTGMLLAAGTTCADGDDSLLELGIAGALRCTIPDTELGLGMFRDLPFEPYASDQALPPAERAADARREIAYRNHARQSADLSTVHAAFATLGGVESSGDPDQAGSQITALHTLATGDGLFAGLGRASVAQAAPCSDERFGHPCFRDGGEPVVVVVTDAPMHNGPDPGSYPYDYNPAQLAMLTGTVPGAALVPGANDGWTTAHALAGDAGSTLAVYEGTSAGLGTAIADSTVGCGAEASAPNAVFGFHVEAPAAGGTVPVTLSTEGSSFPTAIAVFTQSVGGIETQDDPAGSNELFTSANVLGDVTRRHLSVSGDTELGAEPDMGADYQGALFGAACGANTLAPDAAFRFEVASSAPPAQVELRLDMGNDRGVLSVYEAGGDELPVWPARTSPVSVTGNPHAYSPHEIDLAGGYVTLRGDSAALGADYDPAVLGGALCAPDVASMDAGFQIHVDGTRTLRFDTEGSSFDTVLSLHGAPPPTLSGTVETRTAAETHDNMNEDAVNPHDVGVVNGRHQIFEGDTSAMAADVADTYGCGMEGACADAVYTIDVTERTTLRVEVAATAASAAAGFEPAVLVTRADPDGVSGRYAPLAVGTDYSCALSGGGVYCWGGDSAGQLGNGGAAGDPPSLSAVQVTGLSSAVQIGAGSDHACAVTGPGAVHCWGEGSAGQLGDGTSVDQYAPVQVVGVGGAGTLAGVVQVACGRLHCCALSDDGSVQCWGDNTVGQLGVGAATAPSATPVLVSGGHTFEQLAANDDHTCAIRASDDAVLCWGRGTSGRMGDGSTSHNLVPGLVTGVTSATHLIAGQQHNCAVLASGRVKCWGRGGHGQLGQGGDIADHSTPVVVRNFDGSGDLGNVSGGFAGGRLHTCVTTLEGFVLCWGSNINRELGNDSTLDVHLPTGVHELLDVRHVVSSHAHSCALRADGSIACWGAGGSGQLGDGATSTPTRPVRALPGTPQVAFGNGRIETAFTHACRSIAQPPEPGCELRTHNGRRYFACSDHARTWAGAAQACGAVGYGLAEIDEAGENAFAAAALDGPSWIGAKRESSSDWLDLNPGYHFENEQGDRIFHTDQVGHEECIFFFCEFEPTVGWFTPAAAPDLVDSDPYGSASTWSADDQPSPEWGHGCVTLAPSGKWSTDDCSAVPEDDGCETLEPSCLGGGPLGWVAPWVSDLQQLPAESLAGVFSAPHFAGGAEHDYLCEERAHTSELTLDPGRYYVTVKGADDGDPTNACTGGYALQIDDLGSPTSGFITCDDNGVAETSASAIERTLSTGDYYLVVKGKHAADAGPYQLTVRDVSAVSTAELACDASGGAGDPAVVQLTAEPGRSYYALVKGEAPLDKGSYTLEVRDQSGLSSERLGCDASSAPDGSSQLQLPLSGGDYYAVIKGRAASAAGDYRLTVGGAPPVESVFVPPSYEQTVMALGERTIRVATVLSCDGAPCADATGQAEALAADTGGALRVAASAADVPAEIVRVVQIAEAADRVRADLMFAPDANPGYTFPTVTALPDPNNLCSPGEDTASFSACEPGATPSFRVSLTNPALAPVAPQASGDPHAFTLRVTGERDGQEILAQDVPVLVAPSGGLPPGSYDEGSYYQDFGGDACTSTNDRPSWDRVTFDGDVRPDTRVSFHACTANNATALDGCEDGEDSSGYRRVVTVSAGTGAGTPCTVATQAADCPFGYCSPYTLVCNELEGASCMADTDCPGTDAGRCRAGPSAAELGNTCVVYDLAPDPASALREHNYRPFMRLRIDLESEGDGSRTPAVFFWEAMYRCRNVE